MAPTSSGGTRSKFWDGKGTDLLLLYLTLPSDPSKEAAREIGGVER
jgi:hypothetical protein